MKKEKKDLTQNNAAGKSADKKRIFVIAGVVVACLAVIYVGFGIFFQSHFCFGTTIDGIKAGGKSVEKMEQLITEEIDSYVLNLVEREEGQESIAGDSIHIAPVFNRIEGKGCRAEKRRRTAYHPDLRACPPVPGAGPYGL